MSPIHLGNYPTELQYFLLDRMDVTSLVSLKNIDHQSRCSFESDEIVHYLMTCRLQPLSDQARQFGWRSSGHDRIVDSFFQVVSILPAAIKFPKPCDYDNPSELKNLIAGLTQVICRTENQFSDRLSDRSFQLGKLKDERMTAFMTCLPIKILHSTKRAWAELSRRFDISGHLNEAAFYASFCPGIQYINSNGGGDFIQGVSGALLKATFYQFVNCISINYQFIEGFSQIANPVEAHEKVIVLGNWFENYTVFSLQLAERQASHKLEEFNRANTLMNILYMATFANEKMPLDRQLVKSWIPKSFECWEHFSATAKHSTVFPERNDRVKQCFAELFSTI